LWSFFGPTSQATYPIQSEATTKHQQTIPLTLTLSISLVHHFPSLLSLTHRAGRSKGKGRRRDRRLPSPARRHGARVEAVHHKGWG